METLQITIQILSAIVCVLAILQKEKWKMMLMYTLNNIICMVMFFAFGRYTSAYISIVAAIRTIIFLIYAYKKIKPNLVWLIIFETAFVIVTIVTWQDALDLMPMFALLAAGFGSWQDNHFVLRISYMLNATLYIIYKCIIGAYIAMSFEVINLICTATCFVYYCLLKKQTPIMQVIFKNKKESQVNKGLQNTEQENNT